MHDLRVDDLINFLPTCKRLQSAMPNRASLLCKHLANCVSGPGWWIPGLYLVAMVAGMLLTMPSLRVGLIVDDYHAKLLFTGSNSVFRVLDCCSTCSGFLTGMSRRRID